MATGIKINIKSKVFQTNNRKLQSHSAISKNLNLMSQRESFCSIIGPSGWKTTF